MKTNDIIPEFVGDDVEMRKFIDKNLKYPSKSLENKEQGNVRLKLFISMNGLLDSVFVLKTSGYSLLDQEALRIALIMPKWIPASKNGVNVAGFSNLTIRFISKISSESLKYISFYDIYKNEIWDGKESYNKLPSFVGGEVKLKEYLIQNNKFLNNSFVDKNSNYSIVKIAIESNGKISKSDIVYSSGNKLQDDEAVRLTLNMPNWAPAYRNREPVKVYCKIPVLFIDNVFYLYRNLSQSDIDLKLTYEDFFYLGLENFQEKKMDLALKSYNTSLLFNPNDIDALYNASIAGIKLNQKENACKYLKRIQSLGKTDADDLIKKYCTN